MPFADEQTIAKNPEGMCVGGDVWHRGLLLDIVEHGLLFNAYNTPVETLQGLNEVDCFIGGLVATGIPPQMSECDSLLADSSLHSVVLLLILTFYLLHGLLSRAAAGTSPAAKSLIPRIKYWLDLYKVFGMATESSIDILNCEHA